jgi:hypothetical protein
MRATSRLFRRLLLTAAAAAGVALLPAGQQFCDFASDPGWESYRSQLLRWNWTGNYFAWR